MLKVASFKVISVFMVVLLMTLPTFPLLAKFQRTKSQNCIVRSADHSASAMKKLSILLTQMIEEIREDDEKSTKEKGKESGKEVLFVTDHLSFKFYLGCTSHPGVSILSILNGHEQDVLLPPEQSC